MLRRRGQKSLYEAISSARQAPPSSPQQVQPLHPQQKEAVEQQKPTERKPQPRQTVQSVQAPKNVTNVTNETSWPKMPRAATIIGNRIELSLSLGTCVILGLVIIILMVIFFRLGQIYGKSSVSKPVAAAINPPPAEGLGIQPNTTNPNIQQPPTASSVTPVTGTGSNRIVIKTTSKRSDLEPAMEFFNKSGIATEIVPEGSSYKLVTANRSYSNPNVSGTDGYQARQRIIETGKNYKAPLGYEQFRFTDPYGEKVQ